MLLFYVQGDTGCHRNVMTLCTGVFGYFPKLPETLESSLEKDGNLSLARLGFQTNLGSV